MSVVNAPHSICEACTCIACIDIRKFKVFDRTQFKHLELALVQPETVKCNLSCISTCTQCMLIFCVQRTQPSAENRMIRTWHGTVTIDFFCYNTVLNRLYQNSSIIYDLYKVSGATCFYLVQQGDCVRLHWVQVSFICLNRPLYELHSWMNHSSMCRINNWISIAGLISNILSWGRPSSCVQGNRILSVLPVKQSGL